MSNDEPSAILLGGTMHSATGAVGQEAAYSACPWIYTEEIAHRTVNEYSIAIAILSKATSQVSDAGSQTALREVEARLRSAARAQLALVAPRTAGRADLAEYLQRLCGSLSEFVLEGHGIFLHFACEHIALDAAQSWRVGLIVSELIMNARRHAFPERGGQVRVEVARDGDDVCCLVADNGTGVRLSSVKGAGSRIVDALAQKLGGSIDCRITGSGTSVYLRFPAAQS